MSQSSGIKILMGGAGALSKSPAPDAPQLLTTLERHKVMHIDTAVIYGSSEENLGLNDAAAKGFTFDTKIPGGLKAGSGTKDNVVQTGRESLERLKVKQVDVLYIHAPDTSIPFEETLEGIDALHKEGMYKRLGLSNFSPAQVEEVLNICTSKGFVKPSVYQGNYNAFARTYEQTLLPLLRKHDVSFYAYSPMAGGFLSKTSELVTGAGGKGEGRLLGSEGASEMYRTLYAKPALLKGLTKWNEIAEEAGVKPGDMAVRWVRYNSALKNEHGDAIIAGGRTPEQADQTLGMLEEGPLDDAVVKKIDEVWELVKDDAPVDNYHDFIAKAAKDSK